MKAYLIMFIMSTFLIIFTLDFVCFPNLRYFLNLVPCLIFFLKLTSFEGSSVRVFKFSINKVNLIFMTLFFRNIASLQPLCTDYIKQSVN